MPTINVTTDTTLSAVTYAEQDTINVTGGATLTIDATPSVRPGTIQCITSGKIRLVNPSATVPLVLTLHDMTHDLQVSAGGVLEVRGAPLSLGAGTGAQQTFDFTTLFGGAITDVTFVEVEETPGGGDWMPWPIVAEDDKFSLLWNGIFTRGGGVPAAFGAGNTLAGRALFWHETNRTLRSGDGTNGAVIPSGCGIRIPNILITNRMLTNATRTWTLITAGTPTSGSIQLELRDEATGAVIGTTAAIAFNATAAAVDAAVEAVTGVNTCTNSGGPLPTAVNIAWAGARATAPPAVRVVNSTLAGGTSPHATIYETAPNGCTLINCNPLGAADLEWCMLSHKVYPMFENFSALRLAHFGCGNSLLYARNSNGTIEMDHVSWSQSPFVDPSYSQINSVFGEVSLSKVVIGAKGNSNANGVFYLQNLPNLVRADDLRAMTYTDRSSTSAITFSAIQLPPNLTMRRPVGVGGTLRINQCSGMQWISPRQADGTRAVSTATNAVNVISLIAAVNPLISDIQLCGPQVARAGLVACDAISQGIRVYGADMDASSNLGLVTSLQCAGAEIQSLNIENADRAGTQVVDVGSTFLANASRLRKILCEGPLPTLLNQVEASTDGWYDVVSADRVAVNRAFLGVSDFVGGNYALPGLTPTQGHVTFGPFGSGASLELIGGAYTDALGSVYMPGIGDGLIATLPFAAHCITDLRDALRFFGDIGGGNVAGNSFVLRNLGGVTGGTYTLTIRNAAGTLIGTTAPIAWNASATGGVRTALIGAMGITTSDFTGSGALLTGLIGQFVGAVAGQRYRITADGTALTGGDMPGTLDYAARLNLYDGVDDPSNGMTVEFAIRHPGTSWTAWRAITPSNLATSWGELDPAYDPNGQGLEVRVRCTALAASELNRVQQLCIETDMDVSTWTPPDASIVLNGPAPTDVTRMIRASDNTVLHSFVGAGAQSFAVGSDYDVEVYFRRENATGTVLMRTLPATQRVQFGINAAVNLYYGAEVQLAQAQDVTAIRDAVDTYLDAAVSSRLPANDPRVALIPGLV